MTMQDDALEAQVMIYKSSDTSAGFLHDMKLLSTA